VCAGGSGGGSGLDVAGTDGGIGAWANMQVQNVAAAGTGSGGTGGDAGWALLTFQAPFCQLW